MCWILRNSIQKLWIYKGEPIELERFLFLLFVYIFPTINIIKKKNRRKNKSSQYFNTIAIYSQKHHNPAKNQYNTQSDTRQTKNQQKKKNDIYINHAEEQQQQHSNKPKIASRLTWLCL